MNSTSVMLYAEDPGAANFVGPIARQLTAAGAVVHLLADGKAASLLSERGIALHSCDRERPLDVLLDAVQPDLLIAGTAESAHTCGLQLIDLCRARGIPTVGVVDAVMNAEHRFRGVSDDPLAHIPDWLLVPDRQTSERFAALGVAARQIFVVGHPQFDDARTAAREVSGEGRAVLRRQIFPDAAPGQSVIAVLAEISAGFGTDAYSRSPEYTLHGSGRFEGRTEIVLEEVLTACRTLDDKPYLSLRLHPKCEPDAFAPLAHRFDEVRLGGNAMDYVLAADLVIGMTTSLLAEAALMGRPVLAVLPRPVERQWLPSAVRDDVAVATAADEIRAHLKRFAAESGALVIRRLPTPAARATERISQAIDQILKCSG